MFDDIEMFDNTASGRMKCVLFRQEGRTRLIYLAKFLLRYVGELMDTGLFNREGKHGTIPKKNRCSLCANSKSNNYLYLTDTATNKIYLVCDRHKMYHDDK
jgi:hypothetical protein